MKKRKALKRNTAKSRVRAITQPVNAKKPKRTKLEVSDHAVIRFMERVMNVNVDAVRAMILTDKLQQQVAVLGGDGNYVEQGDELPTYWLVLRDFCVVTLQLEKIRTNQPIIDHD